MLRLAHGRCAAAAAGLATMLLVGCTSGLRPQPAPGEDGAQIRLTETASEASLPAGRDLLLAEADRNAAAGPAGPDHDRALLALQKLLHSGPEDAEAAWRAARSLYYAARTEAQADRAELRIQRCLDVSLIAVAHGDGAQGPYFQALCMGEYARRHKLRALGIVPRMVEAAERARERDPSFDHGGPDRVLGGIYLRAPAWPASVGDLDAALEHLEEAVRIAPLWPENHLLLAEALLEDDRVAEAADALHRAKELLARPEAAAWARLWQDEARDLAGRIVSQGGRFATGR